MQNVSRFINLKTPSAAFLSSKCPTIKPLIILNLFFSPVLDFGLWLHQIVRIYHFEEIDLFVI